jgi:hypothetical protein
MGRRLRPADFDRAQEDEEVYRPTLSPEAMTALDARDSALDHVAQAAGGPKGLAIWDPFGCTELRDNQGSPR